MFSESKRGKQKPFSFTYTLWPRRPVDFSRMQSITAAAAAPHDRYYCEWANSHFTASLWHMTAERRRAVDNGYRSDAVIASYSLTTVNRRDPWLMWRESVPRMHLLTSLVEVSQLIHNLSYHCDANGNGKQFNWSVITPLVLKIIMPRHLLLPLYLSVLVATAIKKDNLTASTVYSHCC